MTLFLSKADLQVMGQAHCLQGLTGAEQLQLLAQDLRNILNRPLETSFPHLLPLAARGTCRSMNVNVVAGAALLPQRLGASEASFKVVSKLLAHRAAGASFRADLDGPLSCRWHPFSPAVEPHSPARASGDQAEHLQVAHEQIPLQFSLMLL